MGRQGRGGFPAAAVFEFFVSRMRRRAVGVQGPHSAPAPGKGSNPLSPFSELAALPGRAPGRAHGSNSRGAGSKNPGPRKSPRLLAQDVADSRSASARTRPGGRGAGFERSPSAILWLQGAFGRLCSTAARFPGAGTPTPWAQASFRPFLNPTANPHDVPTARAVLDGGNGNLAVGSFRADNPGTRPSPHYDDLLPLYLKGEGVAIAWSSEVVRPATVNELRLTRRRPPRSSPRAGGSGRGLTSSSNSCGPWRGCLPRRPEFLAYLS